LLGTVGAFSKKPRSAQMPQMDSYKIPPNCQTVSLWTEQFRAGSGPDAPAVQDKYILRVTPFKVWSVLGFGEKPTGGRQEGATIYHITHVRYVALAGGQGYPDEGKLQDRFYGTPSVLDIDGKHSRRNHVARGRVLEIRKCRVGGASNGVETDEVHRSMAPILNYRFEYISA
jgi:hypothetical protein